MGQRLSGNSGKPVSIVIVTHNGLKFLTRCLPSVFRQDYREFEVIVVVNGSTDGTSAWLRQHYPGVKHIENSRNLGYCAATNQGIRQSMGEYIIVLDDDTEMEPGFLAAMVAAAESAEDVGMVASQVLFDHDPTRIDSAGIEVDKAGIAWNRHVGLASTDEPDSCVEVFGSTGAAGLYARKMLDQVGLLDEDFFIYYDDADIAWRGQRAGWRCLYNPAARVRHVHSGTSGKWSSFKTFLLGRNKLWTMIKNYSLGSFLLHLPVILAYELAAVSYGLVVLRDTAALRGRLAALRHIGIPLAKRRAFNRKVRSRPVRLSPVRMPGLAWRMHRIVPADAPPKPSGSSKA